MGLNAIRGGHLLQQDSPQDEKKLKNRLTTLKLSYAARWCSTAFSGSLSSTLRHVLDAPLWQSVTAQCNRRHRKLGAKPETWRVAEQLHVENRSAEFLRLDGYPHTVVIAGGPRAPPIYSLSDGFRFVKHYSSSIALFLIPSFLASETASQ